MKSIFGKSSSQPAAVIATPPSPQEIGENGSPDKVADMARQDGGYDAKVPLLQGATFAWNAGRPENLQAFIASYAAFKRGADITGGIDEGYTNLLMQPVMALLEKSTTARSTLEKLIEKVDPQDRQRVLDLLLRYGLRHDTQPASDTTVKVLLDAGGNINTLDGVILANAVVNNKTDLAVRVYTDYGADLAKAQYRATRSYSYDSEKRRVAAKFSAFEIAHFAKNASAQEIGDKARENTTGGYEQKRPLLLRALSDLEKGDTETLAHFLAGYMALKRGEELARTINTGCLELVIAPAMTVILKADDPADMLDKISDKMTDGDRQTLLDLLLRHNCEKTGSLPLAQMFIEQGANPRSFSDQPLICAVKGGFTDLANMLVREHGANIADAVLDTQFNSPQDTALLQKLYTMMAMSQSSYQQSRSTATAKLRLEK